MHSAWWSLSVPILLFLLLPLAALLLRSSPLQIWHNLNDDMVLQALTLSLTTSTISMLASVILGTPLALVMAKRPFRGKRLVDTFIDLPTVLPPAVAGVALLMAFGRQGIIGNILNMFGVTIAFTQVAVVMAQTFIAAPLFVKTAVAGFATIEPELEQAASLDGANSWEVFRYITVPMARRSLLTGAVLTWARALGEFGATIIFAGNFPGRTQTMPLAIYIGFELDLDIALTLAVILMGLSFLVLIFVKLLFQQDQAT
ncbi:MAG: molybdate ABC transporter permease subunit [Chloroflexi bacterium]|nr:molybdate ABC transporter permease subunit [Chloroflexota bacterium]